MTRSSLARSLTFVLCVGVPASGMGQQNRRWTLDEIVRIEGSEVGGPALSDVYAIAVAEDGTVFVAQARDGRVLVFDHGGRHVRSFGRRGDGPGEFQRMNTIGICDGAVWITDLRAQRLSWFDREGNHVGSTPIVNAAHAVALSKQTVLTIERAGMDEARAIVRRDNGFEERLGPSFSTAGRFISIPFGQGLITRVSPAASHHIFLSKCNAPILRVERPIHSGSGPATFSVTWLSAEGRTLRSATVTYRPNRIDRRRKDAIAAEIFAELTGPAASGRMLFQSPREARQTIRNSLDQLPAYYPPISQGLLGDDGTLWLRREDLGTPLIDWIALSETGALLGEVRLPRAANIVAADEQSIWVVLENDLGVPRIVRYRLIRA
jgi:hypothetical protein